jgi:hypothetical protein
VSTVCFDFAWIKQQQQQVMLAGRRCANQNNNKVAAAADLELLNICRTFANLSELFGFNFKSESSS